MVVRNETFEEFDLFLQSEKNDGLSIIELEDSPLKIHPLGRYQSDLRVTLIIRSGLQIDPFVQITLSFHSRKMTKDIGFKLYIGNLINP